jgi:hypothetical protein
MGQKARPDTEDTKTDTEDNAFFRDLGIDCLLDLVPLHTLARTSSGKLSRSKTREDYIRRAQSVNASLIRASA